MASDTTTIMGEELILHPLRAIYWPKKRILFLADLHLGKATHFRKAGIAVPAAVEDNNLDKLTALLVDFKPSRVLFLGDLFHSDYNLNWEQFGLFLKEFSGVSFELVPGNHDIMEHSEYEKFSIKIHPETLTIPPFYLTHEPLDEVPANLYALVGHIHPGVRMRGPSKQSLRLPCFFFGKDQGILPAFGTFTGLANLRPKKSDKVFVIVNDQVMAVGN